MQSTSLVCQPIGTFFCEQNERYSLPRQPGLCKENQGVIVLNPHQNFEQALEDLSGFSRIWVIFWFHRNVHWKPKVLTPHGPPKRGLFATRSPHRPNPIGLSCLEIIEIKGLEIYVSNHDLLDGTPILDIKPYIEYADAWTDTRQGWLNEHEKNQTYDVLWSPRAIEQRDYLEVHWKVMLKDEIQFRLTAKPFPSPNNRITPLEEKDLYQLAYKTWRVQYKIHATCVEILQITSGYDDETLNGTKNSKWNDVHIHQAFIAKFEFKSLFKI